MASHPHLIFPAPIPAPKPKGGGGGGGDIHLPSHERQIERLAPKFEQLQKAFQGESASIQDDPSGAAPEQVIVFEVIGSADRFLTAVRNTSGLNWLAEWADEDIAPDADFFFDTPKKQGDQLSGRLYMVMSDQRAIDQLISLWNGYRQDADVVFDKGLAAWKDLFRSLRDVRRWSVRDRLEETGVLEASREELEHRAETVRFEAELWCRASKQEQAAAYDRIEKVIRQSGGRCVAQHVLPEIAYHGVLGEVPIGAVQEILDRRETELVRVHEVMFFRPVGQAAVLIPDVVETDEYPGDREFPPSHGEPVVALLDGLPLENHRLLAGRLRVDDPDGWAESYPVAERHHGTSMASLILHGELDAHEPPLTRPLYVRPIMRPDPRDWRRPRREHIPDDRLQLDLFHQAVRRIVAGEGDTPAAAPNVRVINVSVGDWTRPFHRYVSPWARLLDWLAYKYGLLFVVSAGNQTDDLVLDPAPLAKTPFLQPSRAEQTIAEQIREDRHRKVYSPADAINALTVGALHLDHSPPTATGRLVDLLDDAKHAMPSPISRIGPGFRGAIKPELLVAGGRQLYDECLRVVDSALNSYRVPPTGTRPPGQCTAAPSTRPGDVSATYYARGTSNAAALVSRAAGSSTKYCSNFGENPVVISCDRNVSEYYSRRS